MFFEYKPVITNTPSKTEVHNLGYMQPHGYICLSEGVDSG